MAHRCSNCVDACRRFYGVYGYKIYARYVFGSRRFALSFVQYQRFSIANIDAHAQPRFILCPFLLDTFGYAARHSYPEYIRKYAALQCGALLDDSLRFGV